MDLNWILQWWNLVFLVPLGLGLVYLGLYVATGITFGDADADVDADAEVDADTAVDADAEVDADADIDADADADAEVVEGEIDADADADTDTDVDHHAGPVMHDVDAEHAAGGGGGGAMDLLLWLGAGRIPISLLLMFFALIWGAVGFSVNRMLTRSGVAEWAIPLISIPLALLTAALLTRWIARLIGKFLPMSENQAQRTDDLVGRTGVALSPIDCAFGLVQVRSAHGDIFQVQCRVAADRPAIGKDQKVLLVDYDKNDRFFYVIPDELGRRELSP